MATLEERRAALRNKNKVSISEGTNARTNSGTGVIAAGTGSGVASLEERRAALRNKNEVSIAGVEPKAGPGRDSSTAAIANFTPASEKVRERTFAEPMTGSERRDRGIIAPAAKPILPTVAPEKAEADFDAYLKEIQAKANAATAKNENAGQARKNLAYTGEKALTGITKAGEDLINVLGYAGQMVQRSQQAQNATDMIGAGAILGNKEMVELGEKQQSAALFPEQELQRVAGFGTQHQQKVEQKYEGQVSEAGKIAGEIGSTIGYMVPSVLSNIIAPGSGLYTMAASAAGGATSEAKEAGADDSRAVLYGIAVGITTAVTEKFADGVAGVFGKGAADEAVESIVKKALKNESAQFAAMKLWGVLGEGVEEFAEEWINRLNAELFVDAGTDTDMDNRSMKETFADSGRSFLMGMAVSGLLQTANGLVSRNTESADPKALAQEAADKTIADMKASKENGQTEITIAPEGSPAAQAQAAGEEVHVMSETEGAVYEALTGQGMSSEKATKVMPTLMRVINGDTSISNNELIKNLSLADARIKAVVNQFTGANIDMKETSLGTLKPQYRAAIEAAAQRNAAETAVAESLEASEEIPAQTSTDIPENEMPAEGEILAQNETRKIVLNKLTGEELAEETYAVMDRLASGESVSAEEIGTLKEVQEGRVALSKLTEDFIAAHPEFQNVNREDVGTYLLYDEARENLRDKIITERIAEGSVTFDSEGNEVYNGPVRKDKRIDIVIGLPASGKSSSIVNPMSEFYQSAVVDSDIIKQRLPEYGKGEGASLVHKESSDLNLEVLGAMLKDGTNIVLPIVGSKVSGVEKYIKMAKAKGYNVHIHLNELPSSKAIGRMLQRYYDTGRFIDPAYAMNYGDKPTAVYEEIKKRSDISGYSRWNNDVERGKRPEQRDVSDNNSTYAQYSGEWGRRSSEKTAGDTKTEGSDTNNARGVSGNKPRNHQSSGTRGAHRGAESGKDIGVLGGPESTDQKWSLDNRGRQDSGRADRERPDSQSSGESNESGRNFGRENLGVYERSIIPEKTRKIMTDKGMPNVELGETTDRGAFSIALENAKAANPNGGMVDPQSPEELQKNGSRTFMRADGNAGVAVERDGNIVGVFKNPKLKAPGAVFDLILTAVANGGNHLDCYSTYGDNDLRYKYAKLGFKPVCYLEFNREYAPDGWNYDAWGEPDVVLWVHNGDTVEQTVERTEGYHVPTREEIRALPKFEDYDEAKAFQMEEVKKVQRDLRDRKFIAGSMQEKAKQAAPAQVPAEAPAVDSRTARRDKIMQDAVRRMMGYDTQPTPAQPHVEPPVDDGLGAANVDFAGETLDYQDWKEQSGETHEVSAEQAENVQNQQGREAEHIPVENTFGRLTSKHAQTLINSGITTDSMAESLKSALANGAFSRMAYRDSKAIKKAEHSIEREGWEKALASYEADVKAGKVSKDLTAMGIALYNNAVTNGDNYTAMDIAALMVESSKSAAQALQANRMLNKLTPEGRLYMVVRSVENMQDELRQRYGDEAPELEVDAGLLSDYRDALISGDEAAIRDAWEAVEQNIADQMPSTWYEKINTWRYLSMLGNPRTHIRNIVGNLGFAPVRLVKQMTGTALERVVLGKAGEGSGRTKALLNPLSANDRALIQAAWVDFSEVEELVLSGGKYNDTRGSIQDKRTIYRNKLLEGLRKINSTALDMEDSIFSRAAYSEALASYMKAQGIDPVNYMNGNITEEAQLAAREYAIGEAQKATYRDFNQFSDFINGLNRLGRGKNANTVNKVAGVIAEGVLPFKRTPANILVRAVEYSPLEFGVVLASDIKQVKKGVENDGMSVAEMLDHIASGLTGTGLVALGGLLRSMGMISGGADDDEKQAAFNELRGQQEYAMTIGDKNFTLDWLAPEALPLFVGVELYDAVTEQDAEGSAFTRFINALPNIAEPMLNMSMLSSVNDLISNVAYVDEGSELWSLLAQSGVSYLQQFLPTLFGQIERVTERERETTFTDRNKDISTDAQYNIGKSLNKLPGEYAQVPYIDAWGRTESSGGVGERILNNMFNPAYMSEDASTVNDEELQRLYDAGYTNVFPTRAAQSTKVDDVYMSAEEYVEYATIRGSKSLEYVTELLQSNAYKVLTDKAKAEAIANAYARAKNEAEEKVQTMRGETVNLSDTEEAKRGLSSENYASWLTYSEAFDALDDKDGATEEEAESFDALMQNFGTLDEEVQKLLMDKDGFAKMRTASEAGMSAKTFFDIQSTVKAAPVPKGYVNQPAWNKNEVIMGMDISDADKLTAIKQNHAGSSTEEKFQTAYDSDIPLAEIVAYYTLTCEKGEDGKSLSKVERRLAAGERGIENFDMLERIFK